METAAHPTRDGYLSLVVQNFSEDHSGGWVELSCQTVAVTLVAVEREGMS